MTNFIKLTLSNTQSNTHYYINPEYIILMSDSRQGTKIILIDDDIVYVDETLEEILKLIGGLNND